MTQGSITRRFAGFRAPIGTEPTPRAVMEALHEYRSAHAPRFERLRDMYEGDHAILHRQAKPAYKPDNRLVANYAKQIVDTMTGYLLGIPVSLTGDDGRELAALEEWGAENSADDLDAELSKTASIYGIAYEVMWRDAGARPRSSVATPLECLAVYGDTVERPMLWAVRFWLDADGETVGTVYTPTHELPFEVVGGRVAYGDAALHGFPGVPVVEYVGNEERTGLFEGVASLIEAHDDALSEKANDVDYYADAYLSVIGAELDEQTLKSLRDSRIINLAGADGSPVTVQFLAKPESDATQEHLIDRLERLIFEQAMVADVSSEDFGTASGIAIRYRLQAMSNLAATMERKFRRGLRERWRLLLGYAGMTGVDPGAWARITPAFTRNVPANLVEEAQVAAQLSGIVSEQTQLSVLSCVDSPKAEAERKRGEEAERDDQITWPRGDAWRATGSGEEQGQTPD